MTPPAPSAPALPAEDEWRRLGEDASGLDGAALRRLLRRRPGLEEYSPPLVQRLRKDLQYALRYAAAAQLVGDPEVLVEHAAWLADVLAAREVPRDLVADVFASCADVLAEHYPRCSSAFGEAATALGRGRS